MSWQTGDQQPMRMTATPGYEDDDIAKPSRFDDMPYHYGVKMKSTSKSDKARSLLRMPKRIRRLAAPNTVNSPVSIPSLPFSEENFHGEEDTRDNQMRRQRSQASSLGGKSQEQPRPQLQRKSTYLLTDSPVLRAQRRAEEAARRAYEREMERGADPFSADVDMPRNVPTARANMGNADVEDLVLDQPSRSPFASPPLPAVSSPTEVVETDERPQRPGTSSSAPLISPRTNRRRLPTPPSPSAPAPAYYPPGCVPPEEQYAPVVKMSPPLDHLPSSAHHTESTLSPTMAHPLETVADSHPSTLMTAPRPPYVRETSDAHLSGSFITVGANSTVAEVGYPAVSTDPVRGGGGRSRTINRGYRSKDGLRSGENLTRARTVKAGAGPLTAANVNRHNDLVGTTSTLNPLIRTFNSPIGTYLQPVQCMYRKRD
jgi:hypothetical protein